MLKAFSLTQPYATLSVYGLKPVETRSKPTKIRGEIAIHSSKGFPKWARELWLRSPYFQKGLLSIGVSSLDQLPLGAIIGTVVIVMCLPVNGVYMDFESVDGQTVRDVCYRRPDENTPAFAFGDYSDGRYMYFMEKPLVLPTPIPCKGALGFWTVPEDIEHQVREQVCNSVLGV